MTLGIYPAIKALGLDLVRYELTPFCAAATHHGALYVIRVGESGTGGKFRGHACPVTGDPLAEKDGFLFSQDSGYAYPILRDIPVLLPDSGVLASHLAQ